jgi:hypothetical protein
VPDCLVTRERRAERAGILRHRAEAAGNSADRPSAKVASNHTGILRKDSPAVAQAVREVAALDRVPRFVP